ncbi:LysM peptidoglycan-binding domain-containing protein [Flavobacterium sp. Sd200]|uniref:LysM peptidoglycan-binding domain-containing protein n=1 Tax=Flavobacterium sp. Sd200 TaxID=2692211 RepID=UPI00136BCAA4|nr:LysM domain-containing protein [Flavobacterium sp. Sd200]MXN92938.1 LysM peptidoglycan-binding domain-containing protein [Flavobacterium sp. Sd200]
MIAKKYFIAALLIGLSCTGAFAQEQTNQAANAPETTGYQKKMLEPKEGEEFLNHTVELGETVMLISKKYKVKPQDIYEYNPEAAQGIGASAVLQIPMHRKFKSKKAKAAEAAAAESASNN